VLLYIGSMLFSTFCATSSAALVLDKAGRTTLVCWAPGCVSTAVLYEPTSISWVVGITISGGSGDILGVGGLV